MSVQENLESSRAFFKHFNAHDLPAINALHAEGYVSEYMPGAPGPLNEEQNGMLLQGFWTAFPDLSTDVTLEIVQGDYVVSHWVMVGTHTRPLHTPSGGAIQPTGAKIRLTGSTTMEMVDGKHKRAWAFYDQAALLGPLGLLPPM
jgi:predicted ester cyclase